MVSRRKRARAALAGALLLSTGGGVLLLRGAGPPRGFEEAAGPERPPPTPEPEGPRAAAAPVPFHLELGAPSPSAGWEEAASVVVLDLARLLEGRPRAGAYEEARAEAARGDLALFPPDRSRLRRHLLGSERERLLALAALSARPELDDDLLRIVLRSQRPEDDALVRLLGAEIAAALPAELLGRHEEDLLRAFEREPNPLVLALALPALERMEEERLRALLDAQLSAAGPEMLPVLVGLARDRLGPAAVRDLGISVVVRERASGAGAGSP